MGARSTFRGVPQKKGEVPAEIARKLIEIHAQSQELDAERSRLVYQAMKAGASYRSIQDIIPIAFHTIRKICEAHGWPDETEKARRRAEDDEADAWRKRHGLPPVQRRRIK